MKCAWLVGALAIVVLPTVVYGFEVGQRYELTADELALVEGAIKDRLLDPDSAKFKSPLAAYSKDGFVVVCGLVNAKNGYGGYAGFAPYYGYLLRNSGNISFQPDNSAFSSGAASIYDANEFCSKAGISYN
ncbi:hypothetical protein [uncultured Pleomorphomonas sp.]|uniref:hypothetical protein n=1 Tax=uncultured Pleomorphomonas sp. TaxID=442121 RepID=UPI00258747C8|nr:hypothetical protein [uncultured Pleomorphomonas sp.]